MIDSVRRTMQTDEVESNMFSSSRHTFWQKKKIEIQPLALIVDGIAYIFWIDLLVHWDWHKGWHNVSEDGAHDTVACDPPHSHYVILYVTPNVLLAFPIFLPSSLNVMEDWANNYFELV